MCDSRNGSYATACLRGLPGVAALDGLLHPRLCSLSLGHAEALGDHHDLKEAVETVAGETVAVETVVRGPRWPRARGHRRAQTVVSVVEARVARVVVQAKVAAAMVATVATVARVVQETVVVAAVAVETVAVAAAAMMVQAAVVAVVRMVQTVKTTVARVVEATAVAVLVVAGPPSSRTRGAPCPPWSNPNPNPNPLP